MLYATSREGGGSFVAVCLCRRGGGIGNDNVNLNDKFLLNTNCTNQKNIVSRMIEVSLKSHSGCIKVGESQPVRVNCNVGANTPEQIMFELERLKAIEESNQLPDTFMDLSIGQYEKPLYKEIIRGLGCPVGVVPAYSFPTTLHITQEYALDMLRRLADDGLSFFTLHLTAKKVFLDLAKRTRKIPVTSRGGAIVLMRSIDDNSENIWVSILPRIIDLAKEYGIVISLGTTFRPAGVDEACDYILWQRNIRAATQ